MISLQSCIVPILILVARTSSEFTGTCGPEYGRPPYWDCLVALHRFSELHPDDSTLRFEAARYEVVRPRAGGAGATLPEAPPAPDPLIAARDNIFEEIVLAVENPSRQIPTLAEIENLYRPLNTAQDAYEVISAYQARDLDLRVSQFQDRSVAEWRPVVSLLTEPRCDITVSWSFQDEGAWHSLDYSDPSWMLVLQWVEIVAAANAIKDNCLLPHSGGWGGSIKLGLDNRVEVKLSTYSEKGKSKKEEGGIIEVAEPGKGSSRMTRLQAIRDILRKADSATLSGIEHILHAQPGHPPPRDGGETNTCRDTSSCGIAAGCVYEQVINSAVVYGSTLIKKVGHCISLSNLLQDFLSVLETKG